jgi:hypothetical protein
MHHSSPDADEVAAALAAVQLCLAAGSSDAPNSARPIWQIAAVLAAHGAEPAHGNAPPTWANADRTRRARHWSSGLLGAFD